MSNRIVLVDPDGGYWTTVYDPLDRTLSVEKPTARVYTFGNDANSRQTTLMNGPGGVRQFGYDAANRLTTQIQYSVGNPISTFVDSYDPVDNKIKEVRDGVATTWTYDNNYRLLGQQTSGGYATFAYDALYNTNVNWIQGQAPISMTYNVASQLVTSIQGSLVTTFSYDQAGNTILANAGGALTTNSYDCENRLVKALVSAGPSTYIYAGAGLRRSAQEPTKALTTFVRDGSDVIQARS